MTRREVHNPSMGCLFDWFNPRRRSMRSILLNIERIVMATQEEFTVILGRIDVATDNIAEDLRRLAGQIGVGMTPEQEDAVKAALEAAAVKLEAVAATNPESAP